MSIKRYYDTNLPPFLVVDSYFFDLLEKIEHLNEKNAFENVLG